MSLREGCKEILKADCVDLADRLQKGQRRGVKITEVEAKCAICANAILEHRPTNGVIVFWCKHMYHQKCLRSGQNSSTESSNGTQAGAASDKPTEDEKLWCTICQSQQSKRNIRTSSGLQKKQRN